MSTECRLFPKRCRRVSWSQCSTGGKRWRKGGMISCLSTRSFKKGHKVVCILVAVGM